MKVIPFEEKYRQDFIDFNTDDVGVESQDIFMTFPTEL